MKGSGWGPSQAQHYPGARAWAALNTAFALNGNQSLPEVLETISIGGRAVGIKAAAVVLNHQLQGRSIEVDPESDLARSGMFDDIREGFLGREKEIVANVGGELARWINVRQLEATSDAGKAQVIEGELGGVLDRVSLRGLTAQTISSRALMD